MIMKKNKKSEKSESDIAQVIELKKDDVAIVLRGNGSSETICTLKGKHELTLQEEVIIGLASMLQSDKFVASVREYFLTNMQNMLSSKYVEDMK